MWISLESLQALIHVIDVNYAIQGINDSDCDGVAIVNNSDISDSMNNILSSQST